MSTVMVKTAEANSLGSGHAGCLSSDFSGLPVERSHLGCVGYLIRLTPGHIPVDVHDSADVHLLFLF